MSDKPTKTTAARSLIESAINAGGVLVDGLDFSPITDTQRTAIDLHKRGLNVFPIPRGSKKPYILKPLFYSRLHRCGQHCHIKHTRSFPTFKSLFERQNIAVMLGKTSGNLFTIDCDTQADFRGMAAELDRRELAYWAIESARGGAYLMRLAEGEAKNKRLAKWQHVELWGRMRYALMPPSLHPSGVFYQWATPEPYYNLPDQEAPPVVSVTALDWLGMELHKSGDKWQAPDLHGLPEWTANLSRNNRIILAQAIAGTIPEGQRNTELCKPAYDIAALINAQVIDYATGRELLEDAAESVGYPVKDARAMLRSGTRKEGLTRAREGAAIKPEANNQAQAFVTVHNWQGRTGHTDKAVFLACCNRAKVDAGAGTFRASCREIAEQANKTNKTVSKALHRLIAAELLEYAGKDGSGANRYRFGVLPRSYYTTPTCSYSVVVTRQQKTDKLPQTEAQKDVFGRLGAVSWAVYSWLLNHYASSHAEIAKGAGLNRGSVCRVLSRGKNTGALIRFGLVVFNSADHSYHAEQATEDRLERIAASLDVLGRSAKRVRTHQAEREERVNRLLWGAILKRESESHGGQ